MAKKEINAVKKIKQAYYDILGFLQMENNNVKLLRSVQRAEFEKPTVMVMVYSIYGGGAERVAVRIANGLAGEYHVVLIYLKEKEEAYPVDPEVELILMPHFFVTREAYWKRAERIFIRRIKKVRNIRLSISFMFLMNQINIRTRYREKTICCERNNPMKREPENMRKIRRLYRKSDHVIFQTETVRGLFDKKTVKHSSILPNPVSVPVQADQVPGKKIVAIGRMNKQKDHQTLIRAFAMFSDVHPDWVLELYGEGELKPQLEAMSRELGIAPKVFFMGNHAELHERIRDARMFVLSSLYEGFSNALIECMMMGIACISTDCEGSTDILKDRQNGLVVPKSDPDAMFQAMNCLAEDQELYETIRKNAKETATAYEEEKVIGQWIARLKEVTGETKNEQ